MTDVFTPDKRSDLMSRIWSHGNKGTELRLMAVFRAHGFTGWRRQRSGFAVFSLLPLVIHPLWFAA